MANDSQHVYKLTHETSGESIVGPDLAINFDQTLLDN